MNQLQCDYHQPDNLQSSAVVNVNVLDPCLGMGTVNGFQKLSVDRTKINFSRVLLALYWSACLVYPDFCFCPFLSCLWADSLMAKRMSSSWCWQMFGIEVFMNEWVLNKSCCHRPKFLLQFFFFFNKQPILCIFPADL